MAEDVPPVVKRPYRMIGDLVSGLTWVLTKDLEFPTPVEVALLTLDGDRDVQLDVRTRNYGGGRPEEEYNRRTLTWTVLEGFAQLDVKRLYNDLREGGALCELMSRVVRGHGEEWDGQRVVGTLTRDARHAYDALAAAFEDNAYATQLMVTPAELYYGDNEIDDVTAKTTDKRLAALAKRHEKSALKDGEILVDTLRVLTAYRDQLREDADDE